MSVAISYDMGTMSWRLGKTSVAMSYDVERSPQGVDEMSEVIRQTSLITSLPSNTYVAMSLRIANPIPYPRIKSQESTVKNHHADKSGKETILTAPETVPETVVKTAETAETLLKGTGR
eukprot:1547209-Karenia_brevis.AAC.1